MRPLLGSAARLLRRAVTTLVANRVRALGANRAYRETGVKLMADFGRRTITDTGHRVRTYPDEQVRDSILWKAQVDTGPVERHLRSWTCSPATWSPDTSTLPDQPTRRPTTPGSIWSTTPTTPGPERLTRIRPARRPLITRGHR